MSLILKWAGRSAALIVLASAPAFAQAPAPQADSPTFGVPAPGTVNLTGKWLNATPMAALKTVEGREPPLNAKGRALLKKRLADPSSDPNNLCQLQGEPRLLYTGYPFLIMQYQTHIDFMHEVNHTFRIVPVGAAIEPDPDPLWLGHATARVDGTAVTIDGAGYNDKTWLDYKGLPHGEKLKTEERYILSADGQTISGTVRIEDPDYYSRPWITAFTLKRQSGAAIEQFACADDHKM